MRAFNDTAGKHAEEVLLDDVGLVIFDAFEPVGDVEPVTDVRRPRLDEMKLRRVGEPAGDQRRRLFGSRALAEAGRDERPKRDTGGEASCDRRRVLSGNRLDEPRPDRVRHAASLGRNPQRSAARSGVIPVRRLSSHLHLETLFDRARGTFPNAGPGEHDLLPKTNGNGGAHAPPELLGRRALG